LPPRSGLERSDFVLWLGGEVLTYVRNLCSLGNCGRDVLALSLTGPEAVIRCEQRSVDQTSIKAMAIRTRLV
jgi:hypothetical protein